MRQTAKILALALLLATAALSQPAGAQVPVGRALAANCFQCHGTDGRAVRGLPSIAGKEDIAEKMLELKSKTNLRDIMVVTARAYTDEQLDEIGAYFAGIPEHLDEASGASNVRRAARPSSRPATRTRAGLVSAGKSASTEGRPVR